MTKNSESSGGVLEERKAAFGGKFPLKVLSVLVLHIGLAPWEDSSRDVYSLCCVLLNFTLQLQAHYRQRRGSRSL